MRAIVVLILIFSLVPPALPKNKDAASIEAKAIIEDMKGKVYFRNRKKEKELELIKQKSVGRGLASDQAVKCDKGATVKIKFCTGDSYEVTEKDGWYRIPNMTCKKEFIPGFKNRFPPAGRPIIFRLLDEEPELIETPDDDEESPKKGGDREYRNEIAAAVGSKERAVESRESRNENRELRENSAMRERLERRNISGEVFAYKDYDDYLYDRRQLYYRKSFSTVNYLDDWFILYPYDNAYVIPELFTFYIARRSSVSKDRKLHLIISLSAFENNSLRTSSEWTREAFVENDIWTNPKGDLLNINDARLFLENVRKYSDEVSPRLFYKITIAEVNKTNNSDQQPQSFGFQFYLLKKADEKAVLEQLDSANKETGITKYLGRAEIFEKLGLASYAIDEYKEALKSFPGNEIVEKRLFYLQLSIR